jgi:hypothetical protein
MKEDAKNAAMDSGVKKNRAHNFKMVSSSCTVPTDQGNDPWSEQFPWGILSFGWVFPYPVHRGEHSKWGIEFRVERNSMANAFRNPRF